jgi:hypothetical protein
VAAAAAMAEPSSRYVSCLCPSVISRAVPSLLPGGTWHLEFIHSWHWLNKHAINLQWELGVPAGKER